MGKTPIILVTSADIKKIEHERSLISSEIAVKEARLQRLFNRHSELEARLAKMNALLEAVGPDTVRRRQSH